MRRLLIGFRLARASVRVVREAPVLLVPGLVQTAALAGVLALVLETGALDDRGPSSASDVLVLLAAGFVTTAIGVVSGAVVVAVAADRMDGGTAGLRDGVATAARHLPELLAWSAVSATAGVVLRLLEERLGPVGRWVTRGLGVAFALATVLVVPVIVLEGSRAVPAVRRSATLLRKRFGEVVGGETGLGLATFVVFLAALLVVAAPAFAVSTASGITALIVLFVLQLTVTSVLSAVLSVAVHRVATDRSVTAGFGDLTQVFPARSPQSWTRHHDQSEWDAR